MNNQEAGLPVRCPSCGSGLHVTSLNCENCKTTVQGSFELPVLLQLDKEELQFILSFIKSSGSLKEMSKEMQLSYPSVRNYLNALIDKINRFDHDTQ